MIYKFDNIAEESGVASFDAQGILRITTGDDCSLKQLSSFLQMLRYQYAALAKIVPSRDDLMMFGMFKTDLMKGEPNRKLLYQQDVMLHNYREYFYAPSQKGKKSAGQHEANKLPLVDEPIVNGISINSPGWLEVFGKLNPLRAIHDTIVAIRDWRQNKRSSELKNDLLEIKVIKARLDLLADAGIDQQAIRTIASEYVLASCDFLHKAIESGKLTGVELIYLNRHGETIVPPAPPFSPAPPISS